MLHSRLFIYMRGISSQTVYSVSSFTVLNMEALFDSVKSSIVLDVELKMEQKKLWRFTDEEKRICREKLEAKDTTVHCKLFRNVVHIINS